MLKKPIKDRIDIQNNHGNIRTNSTSKTRYNKPIKKYCKSKTDVEPKGSKPHSYCEAFSNNVILKLIFMTSNHKKIINKKIQKK